MPETKPVASAEPPANTINIENVLNAIEVYISKHAILPEGASTAIALWCLAAYSIDQFRVFPKLTIYSPEKRCGKSTVLDLIEAFAPNAVITSNTTAAAIYRLIDQIQPTLIIDEADTFIAGTNSEMTGIINSGHAKNRAYIMRCVGDNHQPKMFSTWTPMVLAAIGELQPTIMDRSVVIPLSRKKPSETVDRIPADLVNAAASGRDKLLKWSTDNLSTISANQIEPPALGNDRVIDNWLPLFTVANQVSPAWLAKCEIAYRRLNSFDEELQESTMLLSDIQAIFDAHDSNKISSADLVSKLIQDKDRPWCEIKYGRPMTQNGLATVLKIYGIKPKVIRINGSTPRGYELSQFTDSFARYLPSP